MAIRNISAKGSSVAYYDSLKRRFAELDLEVEKAYPLLPQGGKDDLRELTLGRVSAKTLKAMGHPYARKTPSSSVKSATSQRRGVSKSYAKAQGLKAAAARASAPLLPINRQSGDLQRSITVKRRGQGRRGLTFTVGFDRSVAGRSMYAVLPRGTRKVVPRGLWTEVRRRWRIRNRAFRDVYVRRQKAVMRST